jgi:hypothetical protein
VVIEKSGMMRAAAQNYGSSFPKKAQEGKPKGENERAVRIAPNGPFSLSFSAL